MQALTFSYAPDFKRLLDYAVHDCAERGQGEVLVEHLLLGLYREDFELVDGILGSFRVESMAVMGRLLRSSPRRDRIATDDVQLSAEAMQALAYAEKEANQLGDSCLRSSHVFVGIICQRREDMRKLLIREEFVRRSGEVVKSARERVRWLRADNQLRSRHFEVLEDGTLVAMDSMALAEKPELAGRPGAVAVRLRMLQRLVPNPVSA